MGSALVRKRHTEQRSSLSERHAAVNGTVSVESVCEDTQGEIQENGSEF